MTTGRINQVTILAPRSRPKAAIKALTPGGVEIVIGRSEEESPSSVAGLPLPWRRGSRDHPFAPTEFPKASSTSETRAARQGVDRSAIYTPQKEDTRTQSH